MPVQSTERLPPAGWVPAIFIHLQKTVTDDFCAGALRKRAQALPGTQTSCLRGQTGILPVGVGGNSGLKAALGAQASSLCSKLARL